MDITTLEKLKTAHTTLKLLNAENMPLIISFLFRVFIEPNRRSIPISDLQSLLDDYLYYLRETLGKEKYTRIAKAYIDDWTSGETAYLRKYYIETSDEPQIDLMPAVEKAIEWLQSLKTQQFIGTESRLVTIFQLLREIAYKTEEDPLERIRVLEGRKKELDDEIEKIKRDGVIPGDPTQIKERFFQVEDTARKLLSDFRQVEHNFRALDRETREKIAQSDKSKGDLLDEIFYDQDIIRDSDQGKSFRSFWEFLMSNNSQEELRELLDKVDALEDIKAIAPERFLFEIQHYLLDAGEKVYKTGSLLVDQLRKYLDDQVYIENRRIMTLIKEIEKNAIQVKDHPPGEKAFITIDDTIPETDFTMGKQLFTPPKNPVIDAENIRVGEADFEMSALYNQTYIDEKVLRANILEGLKTESQVSLSRLIEKFPVEKGVAEIMGYFNIAGKDGKAIINEQKRESVTIKTDQGRRKKVEMPQVIFTRKSASKGHK